MAPEIGILTPHKLIIHNREIYFLLTQINFNCRKIETSFLSLFRNKTFYFVSPNTQQCCCLHSAFFYIRRRTEWNTNFIVNRNTLFCLQTVCKFYLVVSNYSFANNYLRIFAPFYECEYSQKSMRVFANNYYFLLAFFEQKFKIFSMKS